MKLKNIESIAELKVGDEIYISPSNDYKIVAKCEGAIMIRDVCGKQKWLSLYDLIKYYQIEDKSSEWVPKDGEIIWGVTLDYCDVTFTANYYNDSKIHRLWLERGLIFQTEKEAIACAKKMLDAIKK